MYCHRCAPTVDLVLLSHGDLAHSGLYPYAYSRWNLKAPSYTTLPVQAMARIATTEDVEGMREEEDVGDEGGMPINGSESVDNGQPYQPQVSSNFGKKYVATIQEVHEA